MASGIRPGRTFYDDVTLFKSVGLAVQDIAACALAVERAEGLGVGRSLEL